MVQQSNAFILVYFCIGDLHYFNLFFDGLFVFFRIFAFFLSDCFFGLLLVFVGDFTSLLVFVARLFVFLDLASVPSSNLDECAEVAEGFDLLIAAFGVDDAVSFDFSVFAAKLCTFVSRSSTLSDKIRQIFFSARGLFRESTAMRCNFCDQTFACMVFFKFCIPRETRTQCKCGSLRSV